MVPLLSLPCPTPPPSLMMGASVRQWREDKGESREAVLVCEAFLRRHFQKSHSAPAL